VIAARAPRALSRARALGAGLSLGAWLSLGVAEAQPAAPPAQPAPPAPPAPPPSPAAPPGAAAAKVTPEAEKKAKSLFQAGASAYKKTDYAGAVQAFAEAYRLDPRPGILFSKAQAMRKQYFASGSQDTRLLLDAVAAYRDYVKVIGDGGRKADAVEALAELEPLAARIPQSAPSPDVPRAAKVTRIAISSQIEGFRVSIDGAPAVEESIVKVSPGRHTLVISADGYLDEKRVVDVEEGALQSIDVPLAERLASLVVRADAGAEVLVDGRATDKTPLRGAIEIPAGRHLVGIAKNGYRGYQEEIVVGRGERRVVGVELVSTAQRKASYGFFVGGVVGAAAGAVLTGLAFGEQGRAESLEARRTERSITPDEATQRDAARAQRDDLRTGAGVAFGAGAALLATGAFLYLFDRPVFERVRAVDAEGAPSGSPPAPKQGAPLELGLAPLVAPTVGGALLRGRF
jgi:hypothetical protein